MICFIVLYTPSKDKNNMNELKHIKKYKTLQCNKKSEKQHSAGITRFNV